MHHPPRNVKVSWTMDKHIHLRLSCEIGVAVFQPCGLPYCVGVQLVGPRGLFEHTYPVGVHVLQTVDLVLLPVLFHFFAPGIVAEYSVIDGPCLLVLALAEPVC